MMPPMTGMISTAACGSVRSGRADHGEAYAVIEEDVCRQRNRAQQQHCKGGSAGADHERNCAENHVRRSTVKSRRADGRDLTWTSAATSAANEAAHVSGPATSLGAISFSSRA